jgi:tRNA pseudouridine55 synthase
MNGLLLVDKPSDWTSFDVVAKVRGIIESENRKNGDRTRAKVGHAGTLDPFATGLLLILVGSATKQAQTLLKLDKSYDTVIKLGATSSTDDREGEIVQTANPKQPTQSEIDAVIEKFVGEISQTPPQFSAIKVKGKRAYKSARAGEHIELEPRTVTVRSIENLEYKWPDLSFTTSVSSGTYIRSLARDIGAELGVGGYVDVLRRTQIGPHNVNASTAIAQLNYDLIQKLLLPLD